MELIKPILEFLRNSPTTENILIIIGLLVFIIIMGRLIWKLSSPSSTSNFTNTKENSTNKKIEISSFTFIWLAIILPIICFVAIILNVFISF